MPTSVVDDAQAALHSVVLCALLPLVALLMLAAASYAVRPVAAAQVECSRISMEGYEILGWREVIRYQAGPFHWDVQGETCHRW